MTIRQYKPLIFLLAVFILPLAASYGLYFFHAVLNLKTNNYGRLMMPMIDGTAEFKLNPLDKKWKIIYVTTQCEGQEFNKVYFTLTQLPAVLGKEGARIHLILMPTGHCQAIATGARRSAVQWTLQHAQFKSAAFNTAMLWLADPFNNIFMAYSPTVNPVYIVKDLKHVLGASQIG